MPREATPALVMLGPDLRARGGIASVLRVWQAAGLTAGRPVLHLATYVDGGALAKLAAAVAAELAAGGMTIVGITGSSGKTSTKDLIAAVLRPLGEVIAPPGSFNNEIGAPLTACRVTSETRFLVSEMGARGRGHITALARISRPTIGAVLNVGHAHVGEFGSVEAIAEAKGELVEALPPQGE